MRFAALLLTGVLLWTSAQADDSWGVQMQSMRCGRNLVRVGDHAYLLLDHCGDPDFRNTVRLITLRDQLSGLDHNTVQTVEESAVLVTEEWVYRQTPGRLTKILTLTGGVLTDIRLVTRR